VSNETNSWVHRRRLLFFLLSAIAIFGGLYVLYSALNTLRTLDLVEAERDSWQRPADVLRALELQEGNTVVDLGSGAGYFTLKISSVIGSRGQVFAVDLRELSLTFLWIRAAFRTPHNIHVMVGEEDDPHLPAGTLDAVLIANTYHEFRNPRVMIGHVFRSLRPGGRLVIIDRGPRSVDRGPTNGIAHGREVPGEAVEEELRHEGFEIIHRENRFIDRAGDDPWWLVTSRKP
jgi:ubiquinone/menaquinone biosynthesis C-methylase UbiE